MFFILYIFIYYFYLSVELSLAFFVQIIFVKRENGEHFYVLSRPRTQLLMAIITKEEGKKKSLRIIGNPLVPSVSLSRLFIRSFFSASEVECTSNKYVCMYVCMYVRDIFSYC